MDTDHNSTLALRKQSIRAPTSNELRVVHAGGGSSPTLGGAGRTACTSGPHRQG